MEVEHHRQRNKLPVAHNGARKGCLAYSLTGLEVPNLDSNNYYTLPEVFTQKEMPVAVDNMIRSEDLAKWPHLSKVSSQA